MRISTIFTLKPHLREAAKPYTDIHTILSFKHIIISVSLWESLESSRGKQREAMARMKLFALQLQKNR